MEMGESLVAAYFKYVCNVRLVVHNTPLDQEQGEIDLIAIDPIPESETVHLCEVATHLDGLNYGGYQASLQKFRDKMERAEQFARSHFRAWRHQLWFWSPIVPKGLTDQLLALEQEWNTSATRSARLTVVVNERYAEHIRRLQARSSMDSRTTDEPAYRLLQILSRVGLFKGA